MARVFVPQLCPAARNVFAQCSRALVPLSPPLSLPARWPPLPPCPQSRPTTRPLCSTWWASRASPTSPESSTCASSECADRRGSGCCLPWHAAATARAVGHRRLPCFSTRPACAVCCRSGAASLPPALITHLAPRCRRLVQAAFTPKAIRGYMPRMQVGATEAAGMLLPTGPLLLVLCSLELGSVCWCAPRTPNHRAGCAPSAAPMAGLGAACAPRVPVGNRLINYMLSPAGYGRGGGAEVGRAG